MWQSSRLLGSTFETNCRTPHHPRLSVFDFNAQDPPSIDPRPDIAVVSLPASTKACIKLPIYNGETSFQDRMVCPLPVLEHVP